MVLRRVRSLEAQFSETTLKPLLTAPGAKGEDMFRKTHFKIRHIRLNLYDSAAGCGCEAGEQSRNAGCRLV